MTPSEAITVLLARGMTEAAIGAAVGTRQSTINRIKAGKMVPNWDAGQKLVALAAEPAEPAEPEQARAA